MDAAVADARSGGTAAAERTRPSRDRLQSILTASTVALVGASDNSRWSLTAHAALTGYGFPGALFLVNRRGAPAHGRETSTSCVAIGRPIDLAVCIVSAESLPDALRDAAAAGAKGAIALASGFSESGAAGRQAQADLVALADELDITFFGPNCLGFLNLVDGVSGWASPPPVPDPEPGSIALISQSGGIAIQLGRFSAKHGIRFSHVISTGNEAMVDAFDVARTIVEDERVRCIAMFVEAIGDAQRFDELTARAAELDKPIVMMKVGRSALAAEVIASHTGALAGDDALIDVALRGAGVIRVDSLEELVVTAGLVAGTGRLPAGKLGVVSISGGACDVVVDAADTFGTPLAAFSEQTQARLRETGSAYGAAHNPLDVTGAAVGGPQLMTDAVEAVAADPDVGIVAIVDVLPDGDLQRKPSARLTALGEAISRVDKPCVVIHQVTQDLTDDASRSTEAIGVDHRICGIDMAVKAIGGAMRWSEWRPRPIDAPTASIAIEPRPLSEAEALELLSAHDIPIVPRRLATNADEAAAAAVELGYPVVVKVVSPEILHKSDIGGVALDLGSEADVRTAFARVTSAASAVAGARVDGVLVAPMRSGGVELIAGVVRDPVWGLALAVGLGGVWVNVLDDSSLRRLPVDEAVVHEMLGELRGRSLLEGARGSKPADLARLARVIANLGRLALALGPRLESIEINPLRVDGAEIEALDGAVTWS
jgi:acyl-CoA synthetase (NDP forming)